MLAECMQALCCFTALLHRAPATTSSQTADFCEATDVLVPLDLLHQAHLTHTPLHTSPLGSVFLSYEDINDQYLPWLKGVHLLSRYDVFLSYRWGASDSKQVAALFDTFTMHTTVLNPATLDRISERTSSSNSGNSSSSSSSSIDVFLDTRRLKEGRMLAEDFSLALVNSVAVLPVVSVDALDRQGG